MGVFKKKIKVWIDSDDFFVSSKLAINGVQISKIQCIMYPDGTLLISDIDPYKRKRDYGKGYGSMMMDKLIKYSFQNGVHTIKGNLSNVDINHKERLHSFYRKHGFKIIPYSTPMGVMYGEILKKL